MNNYLLRLDTQLLKILKKIVEQADRFKVKAYLVGGIVRDIILDREIFDLDIVLEGDIVFFVHRLAKIFNAEVVVHRKFGTATLYIKGVCRIDFAIARKEYYPYPGALPTVSPGRIKDDLFRRDFTINAMALSINGSTYGELIDLFGGMEDLRAGRIRVLHDMSFIDDPTRIIRAVRFEQRFSFRIERKTLYLIKMELDKNRDDGIRHRLFAEFKKFFKEEDPAKCIKRLYKLNAFRFMDHNFTVDIRHINRIHKNIICYRNRCKLKDEFACKLPLIYLMAILERIEEEVFVRIKNKFHFTREEKKVLLQSRQSLDMIKKLAYPSLRPSQVYKILSGLHIAVVFYFRVRTSSKELIRRIDRFLEQDRFVSLKIRGEDVSKIAGLSGREVGRMLDEVLFKKIDYNLRTKYDEIRAMISCVKNKGI